MRRLALLVLGLLAGSGIARAQNLFVVEEDGVRYPVKAINNYQPVVFDHGRLRHSHGASFSFARAQIFSPGLLDISHFEVEMSAVFTNAGDREFHLHGRFTSATDLRNCFVVLRITGADTGVMFAELPDMKAGQEVVFDQLYPFPGHSAGGIVHIDSLYFSNGLQVLTTKMNPFFIAQQHKKTEAYLLLHQR